MKKLLLSAAIMAISASALAQTTIKYSHVVANDTPKGQSALKFKELLEERSNGEFLVEVFPNSQLYNDDKVLEALLLGDVQIAAPSVSKLNRLTKKLQLFDLPFLFKDMDAVTCFQESDAGQELLHSIDGKGLMGLGYIHNGLKQFSASVPVRVPADVDGKKFRIMSSDVLAAQYQAVNAIPVKKPFSEVFTLLQTKAIDGQESPWSNTFSQKFYEVQPYITVSNHGLLDYMVITSNEFWGSLSEEDQKMVSEAMSEAIAYGNDLAAEINERDRKTIAESGRSEIIELTPEERQQWVDAMRPVWAQFEEEIGAELISTAEACNK
ncbi:TRAP transporter substrate-binding protein [Suttonella sp. R2A3]|uniref:TRAP transporter substrate-binding protein n=1 Tax=Suttonella sp. R2A3 TaxID=2908648 RepID=UPI001F2D912E|nr:TRAP transporter substrate-binding protein [Suttonella sp. R2A3]UJF24891.1 TRAP transporter substrate-binding protein [Suttonella sp. R2A3]